MWEMILAGRYMMIPITLASLVGLAVIIERHLRAAAGAHHRARDRRGGGDPVGQPGPVGGLRHL